jgi:acetoacetate decarboxylase
MPLVRTPAEIAEIAAVLQRPRFLNAQMLQIEFSTRPEVVRRVLPPGLEPLADPAVTALVGRWQSNCVGDFTGGAVFVSCRHGHLVGAYTLAMYMDTEPTTIFGREMFGEPKKLAQISLAGDGPRMLGLVERNGVRLIEIEAELTDARDEASVSATRFNVKAVLSPDGEGLVDDPILTVNESEANVRVYRQGAGRLSLGGTVHDPLDELEVVEVGAASYVEGDVEVRSRIVGRIPADAFLPYAYGRLDYWPALATA